MKLVTTVDLSLPDRVGGLLDAGSCLVSGAGAFVAVTLWDGGERFALVSVTDGTVRTVVLDDVEAVFADHAPTPVLLADDTVGLVIDLGTLRVHGTDLELRSEIAIDGGDVLDRYARNGERPRVTGRASRGTVAGEHVVVLDEPVVRGNPRYLASLQVGEADASWTGVRTLGPDGFPVDPFGLDQLVEDPDTPATAGVVVGDAVGRGDDLLVCVEGSDGSSVRKWGSDFFTLTRVTADGMVTPPIYEQSGWKRRPGKHGIHGRIASSGRYVVLTPVFASGDWKGRQRLLDLTTGDLVEPVLPRDAARMRILDHHGGTFWLSDGAQRILCAEPATVQG